MLGWAAKVAKSHIKKLELSGSWCPTARECYIYTHWDLTSVNGDKEWAKWEADGDMRIMMEMMFKLNRWLWGYCTEDKDEYDKQQSEHPGKHLIFMDWKNIHDTDPLHGTHDLHEVKGGSQPAAQSAIQSERQWHLYTAKLPCSCPSCRGNMNDICPYITHLEQKKCYCEKEKWMGYSEYANIHDPNQLTITNLVVQLWTCNLSGTYKLKTNLVEWLTNYLHNRNQEQQPQQQST